MIVSGIYHANSRTQCPFFLRGFVAMASNAMQLAEGHPESAARHLENIETNGKITFEEAMVLVGSMKMVFSEQPLVVRKERGPIHASDLPMRLIGATGTALAQFADVLINQRAYEQEELDKLEAFQPRHCDTTGKRQR